MSGQYSKLASRRKAQAGNSGGRLVRVVKGFKSSLVGIDWRQSGKFGLWSVVALSVALFIWDIVVAAFHIESNKNISDIGEFFVHYHPHAEGQLTLWIIASVLALVHVGLRRLFHVNLPEVSRTVQAFVHVVLVITCIDIVVWTGECYFRTIGEREIRLRQLEFGRKTWTCVLLECAARAVDFNIRDEKKIPKKLSKSVMKSCPLTDFWDNELRLDNDSGKLWVVSAGADGAFGTEDDLKCEVTTMSKVKK